jgi:hypothetical protein
LEQPRTVGIRVDATCNLVFTLGASLQQVRVAVLPLDALLHPPLQRDVRTPQPLLQLLCVLGDLGEREAGLSKQGDLGKEEQEGAVQLNAGLACMVMGDVCLVNSKAALRG